MYQCARCPVFIKRGLYCIVCKVDVMRAHNMIQKKKYQERKRQEKQGLIV